MCARVVSVSIFVKERWSRSIPCETKEMEEIKLRPAGAFEPEACAWSVALLGQVPPKLNHLADAALYRPACVYSSKVHSAQVGYVFGQERTMVVSETKKNANRNCLTCCQGGRERWNTGEPEAQASASSRRRYCCQITSARANQMYHFLPFLSVCRKCVCVCVCAHARVPVCESMREL